LYTLGLDRALRRSLRIGLLGIAACLMTLFVHLLLLRLKFGKRDVGSFSTSFTPVYIVQGVLLGRDLFWVGRKLVKRYRGTLTPKPFSRRMVRVMALVAQLPILAFTVMFPIVLDSFLDDRAYSLGSGPIRKVPASRRWFVVFSPLWVFLPTVIICICFSSGKAALADVAFSVGALLVGAIPAFLFLFRLCTYLVSLDTPNPGDVFALNLVKISVPLFVAYSIVAAFLVARMVIRCLQRRK
jgi:hypothetical protein